MFVVVEIPLRRVFLIATGMATLFIVSGIVAIITLRPRPRTVADVISSVRGAGGKVIMDEDCAHFSVLRLDIAPGIPSSDWTTIVEVGCPIDVLVTGQSLGELESDSLGNDACLRELTVNDCRLDPTAVAIFSGKRLRELRIRDVSDLQGQVSAEFYGQLIDAVAVAKYLDTLVLDGVPIRDSDLKVLSEELLELQQLAISGPGVTCDGIAHLAQSRIRSLTLNEMPDGFVESLSQCQYLTCIRCAWSGTTASTVCALFDRMPLLDVVYIDGFTSDADAVTVFEERGIEVVPLNGKSSLLRRE